MTPRKKSIIREATPATVIDIVQSSAKVELRAARRECQAKQGWQRGYCSGCAAPRVLREKMERPKQTAAPSTDSGAGDGDWANRRRNQQAHSQGQQSLSTQSIGKAGSRTHLAASQQS